MTTSELLYTLHLEGNHFVLRDGNGIVMDYSRRPVDAGESLEGYLIRSFGCGYLPDPDPDYFPNAYAEDEEE